MMWRVLILLICATPALSHPTPQVRAVFQDGRVLSQSGNRSIDTPFAVASVGKLFTTVAFLRLAERGVLGIDDLATDWIASDIAQGLGGLNGVRLDHLATMTAGLPDYYDDAFLDGMADVPLPKQTTQFALSFMFDQDPLFEPGAEFDYSNTNFLVLSLAMQAATGKSYADLVREEIIGPAALHNTIVFGENPLPKDFPKGHTGTWHVRNHYTNQGYADGGVLSSAADLERLYTALRDGALLSPQSIQTLRADPIGAGYGMGLVIEDNMVGHSGGDVGFASLVAMHWDTGRIAVELYGNGDADTGWAWEAVQN